MPHRIRHCVECPKCHTRYLIGSSPYRNGSYIVSSVTSDSKVLTLYCSCGRPATISRWSEFGAYAVSNGAYDRGYGPPNEIVSADHERQNAN